MSGGYRDCVCCGTCYVHDDDPTIEHVTGPVATDDLCEVCAHLGCGDTGDDPSCRVCLLDGSRGVYLPNAFATSHDMTAWGVSEDDVTILRVGPTHEHYWEAWDDVTSRAEFTDDRGVSWCLEPDGDLLARAVSVARFEIVRRGGKL